MYEKGTLKFDRKSKDFYLPHSCDEWIIGDEDNLRLLLEDIKAFLKLS